MKKTAARSNPNAYLQTQVMTANPAELRLMLFDGAIRFARQAREETLAKNWEGMFNGITRCQQILLELTNSLRPDHNPELCSRLSALYTYMYTRLIAANTERKCEYVDEVIKLLEYERETWSMLLDQLAAENKSASRATNLPTDVEPTIPLHAGTANHLIGATVSVRG